MKYNQTIPLCGGEPVWEYAAIEENVYVYLRAFALKEATHLPGGFLQGVLYNDLSLAIGRADPYNLKTIRNIMYFVWNEVPSPAWKSKEAVYEWLGLQEDQDGNEPPAGSSGQREGGTQEDLGDGQGHREDETQTGDERTRYFDAPTTGA